MATFYLAAATIRAEKPDFFISENSDNQPFSLMQDTYGDLFDMVTWIVNPFALGYALDRKRRYVFGWLKTHRFLGSEEEYIGIFKRRCVMTGDDYLVSGDGERLEFLRRLAMQKMNNFNEGDAIDFEYVFTSSEFAAYLIAKSDYAESGKREDCIVDLSKSEAWSKASTIIQGLVTKGKLFSISQDKLFTPVEHMAFMGENALGDSKYPCLFRHMLEAC